MKKAYLYLLAAMLLSACKQEGTAEIILRVNTPQSQRPDAGAAIYFVAADSTDYQYLNACLTDTPDMIVALLHNNIDLDKQNIELYEGLLKKALTPPDRGFSERMLAFSKESIEYDTNRLAFWQKKTDTAMMQVAAFTKQGIKQTTDANGVCTIKLEAGKYRVLIESNTCRRKTASANFDRYYLDSITVTSGTTATLTRIFGDCK